MSNDLITAAWKKDLPPNRMLVIICLCDWANDDGVCWPSLDRIAWKTGLSKRSVQRIIAGFEEEAVISKQRRYHTSTVYTVSLDHLPDKSPFESSGQSDTCQLGHPPDEDANSTSERDNRSSESAKTQSQSDKLWPPIHQYDPSDISISLEPAAHPKERMRGTAEEEFLYQQLRQDKRTLAALRAGRVPPRHYDEAVMRATNLTLAQNPEHPVPYALKILANQYEHSWFEETKEDRIARGRTAIQPG